MRCSVACSNDKRLNNLMTDQGFQVHGPQGTQSGRSERDKWEKRTERGRLSERWKTWARSCRSDHWPMEHSIRHAKTGSLCVALRLLFVLYSKSPRVGDEQNHDGLNDRGVTAIGRAHGRRTFRSPELRFGTAHHHRESEWTRFRRGERRAKVENHALGDEREF